MIKKGATVHIKENSPDVLWSLRGLDGQIVSVDAGVKVGDATVYSVKLTNKGKTVIQCGAADFTVLETSA